MSLRGRIIAGMGANAGAQAISIFIQLGSLPLFLHYWSITQYGTWLIISAVPSYLSMADVGMVTAAGNEMTMAVGRADLVAANRIFQSALFFMTLVCGGLALLAVPVGFVFSAAGTHNQDQRLALVALIGTVLLTLYGGLADAIFRATGRYALGTTLANLLRLGEWCGCIVGLAAVGSFFGVAVGGLAARAVGLTCLIIASGRGHHGLRWGLRDASWRHVRAMLRPAFSFMAFPLSNALNFQGMTLLVGSILGPAAVTVFGTYRTLARVAVQGTSILSYAVWTEFSLRFGRGGSATLEKLYRKTAWLGAAFAVATGIVLYVTGPWLLRIWTHSAVHFDRPVMVLMLIYAAIGSSWHVPRVLLLSTNEHSGLAIWSVVVAAASLALADALSRVWKLEGVALSMLLSELAIAAICIWLAQCLLRRGESALPANGVA
jgi:O-antigen/teichoic acid export membrane protein